MSDKRDYTLELNEEWDVLVDRLINDCRRMDWLSDNWQTFDETEWDADTLREAIDAAMEEEE